MRSNANIVMNKSVRWRAICCLAYLTAFAALLLACSSEPADPFDEESIKDHLKSRSLKQIHDEYERSSWTPPQSGLLTEAEISSFVQMAKLSSRISEINGPYAEQIVDEVSHIEYPRMPQAATVRASLLLGLNPREMKWANQEIRAGARRWKERRAHELRVEAARQAWKAEPDLNARAQRARALDTAKADFDRWKDGTGDSERGNSELVARHRAELAPIFPALRDR